MKTLELARKPIDLMKFRQRSALEEDFDTLITDSCVVTENGKIRVVYLTLDWDTRDLVAALGRISYQESTRTNGLKTTSRIFGYAPRVTMRRDFCTAASISREHPAEHALILEYGKRVAAEYARTLPEMYAAHSAVADKQVLPDWRIEGTPFTSGIVNKNNPLKYHFDSGNFKGVYSNMLVFKRDIDGGYLSCPEYGVGFELKNNTLLMFDGQDILHGVTPIRRLTADATRFSIVFYSLRGMWKCETVTGEIARIRKVKTAREIKRRKK